MREKIILLLVVIICFSCKKSDVEYPDRECISTFDATGLHLYKFTPFTIEQWKVMDYAEKLKHRQIPPEFMRKMNTDELFIQFIHMDMAKDVLMFNTLQKGFIRAVSRYNVLQELYQRSDAVSYFIQMLNNTNIENVKSDECRFYYLCLQMFSAQVELIGKMNMPDTKRYVDVVYRIMEDMTHLSSINKEWESLSNYTFCTIAFANIMITYNYTPFIDLMRLNKDIDLYINGDIFLDEILFALISDKMLEFYKQLK
ncbi:MAG: hypothetical protein Q4G63_12905 [Bacteroidia bacterium]|nr:hypothetical protein [Bacteroidia bacterium]